ncbi:alpha/beta-Hydrolase [Zalerion maritima]|uniref:Alpha/beta-Hydrolase n=1 Tax=Zalerion maritima TaxID=339359 RepID=A0AAD5RWX4_9PEZI|nr:alpha/beta-Hydrolase [Zalerion maritima]
MRILALHGMGTSGPIFESQTSSFRARLPKPAPHSFTFPSAPFPSPPAPGIDIIYPPSENTYHSFYIQMNSATAVQAACHWLDEYLETHGPFDALMGFSQGCALIGSWLLYRLDEAKEEDEKRRKEDEEAEREIARAMSRVGVGSSVGGEEEDEGAVAANGSKTNGTRKLNINLPVKAALFICGGPVLPVLSDLGVPVSPEAEKTHKLTVQLLKSKAGKLVDIASGSEGRAAVGWTPGSGLWDKVEDLVHDMPPDCDFNSGTSTSTSPTPRIELSRPGEDGKNGDKKGGDEDSSGKKKDENTFFGLNLSPDVLGHLQIPIPTAHIYGIKDPRYPASIQLAHLCDPKRRQMFDHGGGHDIPRSSAVSIRIAELLGWLEGEIKS